MAIPEGYQFLAKLGIVYKEDYDESVTYNQYDAVYYNGSTYIALVDSPVGPPTADGANWQYMAQGFLSHVISSLTATDKNGVIGEAGATVNAQDLIDGMSDDIKGKLDNTGDASDTIVTFEQASERTNIISGESHKTILGKIKKWFADMTAAAFAQIITSNTDLMATTVAGYLVDALAVKQQFDVVNSNLNSGIKQLNVIGNQNTFSATIPNNKWTTTHYYYKNTQTFSVLHHCKGFVIFPYISGGVRAVVIDHVHDSNKLRLFSDSRLACEGAFRTEIPFDFTITLDPNDEIIMNLCQYNSESSEMSVDIVYYINEVKVN